MNVKQQRRRVERAIRSEPATEEWRAEFLDLLNDKLDGLVTSRKWSFRQRLHNIRLYSGLTLFSTSSGQAPAYMENTATSGELGFEFAIPDDWELYDVVEGAKGHTVTISGNTSAAFADQQRMNRTFVIEECGEAPTGMYIKLDPRYLGDSLLTGSEVLTFEFRRYKVPVDLADVFAVAGRGPDDDLILDEMSLAEESRRLLNDSDGPGTPSVWIADPNYPSPYEANQARGQYPNDFNPPPPNALSITPSIGGTLTVGSTYTYRYAWRYGGFWSESSPEASATIAAPNQTLALTLDALDDPKYGRTRTIFRRENEGPWYRIADLADPSAPVFSDGGAFNPFANPSETLRERTYHAGGLNRFARFYPLSDRVRELEIRYLSRPPLLETESDVPEIPGEFHQVLVHMIAMDLLANANQAKMSDHQERLMNKLLDTMSRRYLTSGSVRIQRQGVFRGHGTGMRMSAPRFVGDG